MSEAGRSLAPVTGIVFVALLVSSFIVGGETPAVDASSQEIRSFYADNEAKITIASLLFALGAIFLLFFIGSLRSVLGTAEGGTAWLSQVAFAGGVVAAVGILLFAGLGFTLGDAAGDLEPAALQAINALSSDLFFPLAAGIATLLFATGLLAVRTKVLPAWMGWAALVLAVVSFSPLGFFAFLASLLWLLIVSILLVTGTPAAPTSPPQRTPS